MTTGRTRGPIRYLVAVVLALLTFWMAELWVLPLTLGGLTREVYLMGFAATPGALVDDTVINSMGFTGDVLTAARSPGTLRILTLGGSALFNRRMTERIIAALETSTSTPVEVLGAALRTHTTRSSLLKYRLLARYDFDVVLIYHGINDLWANHGPEGSFRSDYSQLDPWYVRSFLLDHSLTARWIYNQWIYPGKGLLGRRGIARTNQAGFAATETFRSNLEAIVDLCLLEGATPVLMTFAWSLPESYSYQAFESEQVGYNNPEHYDRYPAELWGSPDYVREGLRRHNAVIRQIAESKGVPLLDQERLMGKDLVWFGDICHFSEPGTGRFVSNLVRFLLDSGLIVGRQSGRASFGTTTPGSRASRSVGAE